MVSKSIFVSKRWKGPAEREATVNSDRLLDRAGLSDPTFIWSGLCLYAELLVEELILFPQVPNLSQSYLRHWEHLAQDVHIFQVQIKD